MEAKKLYRHALRHLQQLVNINNSETRKIKLVKLLPASEIKAKFINYARKEFELNKRKLQNEKLTDEQIALKVKQFKRIVKHLGQAVEDASHETNKRRFIEQSSSLAGVYRSSNQSIRASRSIRRFIANVTTSTIASRRK